MAELVSMQRLRSVAGKFRASIFLITVVLGSGFRIESKAQEPPRDGPVRIDQAARNRQPAFLVRADVNQSTRDYRQGDALSVRVASEVDAYLYVLYQQADGRVFQIFPNVHQPENRVPARRMVEIPSKDDAFRWSIGPPFGDEVIKVIASRRPVAGLSDPAMRQKRFNPVPGQQVKGVELELGAEPPAEWSEHDVKIHTYPRTQELAAPSARRYGVFFGVAAYAFNAEYELASEGKARLNLPACDRDASTLGELLRQVGQLSDLRVYTNDSATREQLAESVTQWLPAVSRPGDTVIIYFSGHGLQIPDDDGDEADGLDEVLAPHDIVTGEILIELIKKARRGEPVDRRLKDWIALVKQEGPKAGEALIRRTAVTDDEFGHWLQRLDGRQVIVILDICHSGGFANREKEFSTDRKSPGFDFLDRECARLKDIGQRGCSLLAACGAQESAQVRREADMSVMTYYLAELLQQSRRQVELPQAYEYCRDRMKDYFDTANRTRRVAGKPPVESHEPYLVQDPERPIYLKP
jgi:hypothetical protein